MSVEKVERAANYSGFEGLHTDKIAPFVMSQKEIMIFFGEQQQEFKTAYAYPRPVADALSAAIFSMDQVTDEDSIVLTAKNALNPKPQLALNSIGSL